MNTNVKTYDRVVDLLNQASLMTKDDEKIKNLRIVEELIINKEPNLLDNFLDEMLAFQTDRGIEVKKYILHFMAVAGKTDAELLPRIVENMTMMMSEENINVIKVLVLNMSHVFKTVLKWIATSLLVTNSVKKTWSHALHVLETINEFIDSDNEGLRSSAIKFLEVIVLVLSKPPEDLDLIRPSNNKGLTYQDDVNLTLIHQGHPVLKVEKLEEEGKKAFDRLMSYQSSIHISSLNLMTVMTSMTNIAKLRPNFIGQIVQGFESLHVNLPPTLTKSQVSSVRKHLKMQMLALLRLPASVDYQSNIAILLTDLGASQSEVMKNMPKVDVRKRKAEENSINLKRIKLEQPISASSSNADFNAMGDDNDFTPVVAMTKSKQNNLQTTTPSFTKLSTSSTSVAATATSAPATGKSVVAATSASTAADSQPSEAAEVTKNQSAVDITADDLVPRLIPQNVADLVLLSMVMLPDQMPPSFQSTYTPIAAAGTPVQIRHMARLLAAQLTNSKLGKGFETLETQKKAEKDIKKRKFEHMDNDNGDDYKASGCRNNEGQTIGTVLGGTTVTNEDTSTNQNQEEDDFSTFAASVQPTRKSMLQFVLEDVTKSLDCDGSSTLTTFILKKLSNNNHLSCFNNMRWKANSKIVCTSEKHMNGFLDYIFSDLRNRSGLILNIIYHEYINYQTSKDSRCQAELLTEYEDCVVAFLRGLLNRPDQKDGTFFNRVVLEAPMLTPRITQVLQDSCLEESRIYLGMTTLKELIIKGLPLKADFLDMLLSFAAHEKPEVRQNAIRVIKSLHERCDLQEKIENHAMILLKYLLLPVPPLEVFKGEGEETSWSDDSVRLCLYLYMGLLPVKHQLIHELASVYTSSSSEIKRVILRAIETPIKGMGMKSPELLQLVETCPKGAETLVTRIIHILTDKMVPSPELVDKVRDLYQKRVSDIRFLIPVLTGLSKNEVISALPKLIKLNPVVVKEVFNRLLGVHGQESRPCSLNPTELLVTLHTLDNKVDMKTIIKACNLCFAEKSVYTQEVLAVVMQQLMDINPLPTLLMRTVIQSLATYPKLSGFVLNILQRLISKQVWKNKRVWEGFIRCCQRTKPQSFQVLIQLPPAILRDAFLLCPDLREPLLNHVISLTPHQRAHIPKAIMSVLEKPPTVNPQGIPEQMKVKPSDDDKGVVQKSPKANSGLATEENDEGYEVGGASEGEEFDENATGQSATNEIASVQAPPTVRPDSRQ